MMKKLVLIILLISIGYSCSTNTDSDGNSNTTVIPLAPSNLTGTVISSTQINLSWTDNSTNETSFKIERKSGSSSYAIVGTTLNDITTFVDSGLIPGTTYTYRVYSNNSVGNSLTYSNELTLTTTSLVVLPVLTTTAVSSITDNTAVSGGNITSDGGAAITSRGVCWNTSPNPTIALTTKTSNGSGTGNYSSNLTGLSANTTYYVRAYATNSVGTAYGAELSFTTSNVPNTTVTDIDGNTYQIVTICNQKWTKSNLNVSRYRNGDVIPQVTDATQWATLTTGAWCYYANTTSNGTTYGKLYNWYAVNDPRGLAPAGWHIATDSEWNQLSSCLGGDAVAGGKLKEAGTAHWQSPNTGATNSSGFTALPGGSRGYDGQFSFIGTGGFFWISTETNANNASIIDLGYTENYLFMNQYNKKDGLSVRLIKD